LSTHVQISGAEEAFSKQASSFDKIDFESEIIKQMRLRVYAHTDRFLKKCSSILELNAGTGIDGCHFAEQGHSVLATDVSEKMLAQADLKIRSRELSSKVKTLRNSFQELDKLGTEKKYDHIFSDFGGLNCAEDFKEVGKHFRRLLKPGGHVTLVMISPFCLWETSLALKGNFRLAFRRFKKGGTPSLLEGVHFKTYYYWPKHLQRGMGEGFELKALEGLAVLAPPPYLEARFKNRSGLLKQLFAIDDIVSKWPVFSLMGDHFIATFRYNP